MRSFVLVGNVVHRTRALTTRDCVAAATPAGHPDTRMPGRGPSVEHCIGPLGVGTLIVKPKRHVVHVADLTEPEVAEMGPPSSGRPEPS